MEKFLKLQMKKPKDQFTIKIIKKMQLFLITFLLMTGIVHQTYN